MDEDSLHDKLREKALALPMKPGVYLMRDDEGTVIYVGKAKLLKNRVSSYFHGNHNLKTEIMISKINDFSVIVVESEFEALVLENSLIKYHSPRYNILLKDDKGYPFIKLDIKSEYPRFTVASKRDDENAEYFGPYGSRGTTSAAIDALCKTLKLPTCTLKFPRDIGKERPCLNFQLGRCDGYCRSYEMKDKYIETIDRAKMILKGKSGDLIDSLTSEMEEAAENLRFEEAAEKRDMIRAINSLETHQHVLINGKNDTDAIGFFRGQTKTCFNVLHYVSGQLLGKDTQLIDDPIEDTDDAISLLVRQYYASRASFPKTVLIPENIEDMNDISRFLSELAGHNVELYVPQRGYKHDYIIAAMTNAEEETIRLTTKAEKESKTAQWLKDALKLNAVPHRIESYDISNTGASDIVASMVVFENGKPLKSDYRRFKINSLTEPNDYESMRQVISRRCERFKSGDSGFSKLPDFFLIDGGSVHASVARDALNEAGVDIPVFGMVKDDRHRTRELVTPNGEEIGIESYPAAFSFIGTIQEETHRFAVIFHRESHGKSTKNSKLEQIPGVGEKRRIELLKRFKSMKAISSATIEELSEVVPKTIATNIYMYFHDESGE